MFYLKRLTIIMMCSLGIKPMILGASTMLYSEPQERCENQRECGNWACKTKLWLFLVQEVLKVCLVSHAVTTQLCSQKAISLSIDIQK